jgi:hypothetical protein
MVKKLIVGGAVVAALAAVAACDPTSSTTVSVPATTITVPAIPSSTSTTGFGVSPATFVSQFRTQFPSLAAGKTDQQILNNGEADCNDMAAAGKVTTPSMAKRYGLSDSTADKFTLNNIGLLATFTLCGIR